MHWANFLAWRLPADSSDAAVDQAVTERYLPLVRQLLATPAARMTFDVNGALTERLAQTGYNELLEGLRTLLERGQIELTGSALHQPVLPLIPPQEAVRQIRLNTEINRRYLGEAYQPQGFFPPEMAAAADLLPLVRAEGFSWVMLDEIAYDGRLSNPPHDRSFTAACAAGLRLAFRNRSLSVRLAFGGFPDGRAFLEAAAPLWRPSGALLTAAGGAPDDGPAVGYGRLLDDLLTSGALPTCTISEAIARLPAGPAILPRAASWCSEENDLADGAPFAPWSLPGHALHEAQWRLTNAAIRVIQSGPRGVHSYTEARQRLDAALGGGQYWWGSGRPWWNAAAVLDGAERLRDAARTVAMTPGAEQAERAFASVAWQTDRIERERMGQSAPLPAAPPRDATERLRSNAAAAPMRARERYPANAGR
ncbi:MAG: hypothetical protein NTZ05_23140 [Chloroflexi bacterium]|nr:hypothetical protein [Chloroflexota bacterium]